MYEAQNQEDFKSFASKTYTDHGVKDSTVLHVGQCWAWQRGWLKHIRPLVLANPLPLYAGPSQPYMIPLICSSRFQLLSNQLSACNIYAFQSIDSLQPRLTEKNIWAYLEAPLISSHFCRKEKKNSVGVRREDFCFDKVHLETFLPLWSKV